MPIRQPYACEATIRLSDYSMYAWRWYVFVEMLRSVSELCELCIMDELEMCGWDDMVMLTISLSSTVYACVDVPD